MVDIKTIGAKIRRRRIDCNMSQARLGEICGVGTTHISHIETGNCTPSLTVFIDIVNALGCSADELLCDELGKAEHTYSSEISELLEDCTSHELMIITDTIQALKYSLRKGSQTEQSKGNTD
jgi:transcriptional regulator with XRE-family HTH domain